MFVFNCLWVVSVLWRISSKITSYAFLYFSLVWLESVFNWKCCPPIDFWYGYYQNKSVITKIIQASQDQTMQKTRQEEVRFNLFLAVVYPPIPERHKDSFTLAAKKNTYRSKLPRQKERFCESFTQGLLSIRYIIKASCIRIQSSTWELLCNWRKKLGYTHI